LPNSLPWFGRDALTAPQSNTVKIVRQPIFRPICLIQALTARKSVSSPRVSEGNYPDLSCLINVAWPQHMAVSLWLTGWALGFMRLRLFSGGEASKFLMTTNPVSPRLTAMCCAEGASVHLLKLSCTS